MTGGGGTGSVGRVAVGREVGLGGCVVVVVVVGLGGCVVLVVELDVLLDGVELELVELGVDDVVVVVLVGAWVEVTGGAEYVVVCLTSFVCGSGATFCPLSAACMKSSQMVAGVSPP